MRRGIVDTISARHSARILKKKGLQPHLIRYWLTPAPDKRFDEKVGDINSLYQQAQNLVQKGEIVMSITEMTGVQALERKYPGLQWHQEKRSKESLNKSGMELNLSLLALR